MLDVGSVSRRSFLKIGALGLGGLALPDLLRVRAADAAAGKSVPDTAAILIWCDGGPSQFETYDPKPEAPVEYRGPCKAIQTKLAGVQFCELLPRQAQLADKLTIIRSCAHKESGHGSAVKNLNTGYPHWPNSMSVLMAGGSLKMGQVIGTTDARGTRPKDRPLHPNDVMATLYKHLGIDTTQTFINPAGRPIPILPHGEAIAELL